MSVMQSSPGKCDAHDVSSGDLKVGWCESLTTAAVSISRLQDQNCVFKIFRGDGACGVDATEMVRWAGSQSQDDVEEASTAVADEDNVSLAGERSHSQRAG